MIKAPPARRTLDRDVLTDAELHRLAMAATVRYDGGVRARALIYLLAHGGLRCSEALTLRVKDIGDDGAITVQHGKGDKRRVVQHSAQGMAALATWLERRRAWGVPASAPVFCSRSGARLDGSYVRRLLPRLAVRAGIAKRVHPHGLRHHTAVELERRGLRVTDIQRQLGHAHLSTTSVYLTRLDPQSARAAVRRAWDEDDEN